jgi:sugar lactone lactonase YvrE
MVVAAPAGNGKTTAVCLSSGSLGDLTISNGLGWSPDGQTMYLVDSGPGVVYGFAFDSDRGPIAGRHVLITIAEEAGTPGGMTVDAAGDIWVAIYGGGRVDHCSPDGSLRQAILVSSVQTTCSASGGPRLHRFYVSTATENWSDEEGHAEAAAGVVTRATRNGRPPGDALPPEPRLAGRT